MVNYSPEQVRKYLETYERIIDVERQLDLLRSGKSGEFNFPKWKEMYEASKEIPKRLRTKEFKDRQSRLERFLRGFDLID